MDNILINSLTAAGVLSLISLVGALTFFVKEKLLQKISIYLVAFSVGALIAGAFFHLLPEAVEISEDIGTYGYVILGIIAFFILEKYLKWHHCHKDGECKVHTFTYMSLIGDVFHNFIDGLVVVSAFSVSFELGVAATIAVAAHEIPQELGDFGILIHGGFSRLRALFWNFVSSLSAILGALIGYFMISASEEISALLLPFAAGGFIYIAMTDLVPELHKENKIGKSIINLSLVMIAIFFMYYLKIFFEG